VKPASLEWDCIPDPASPYKIVLQNTSALPWQEGNRRQQETMDNKMSALLYSFQKLSSLCTVEAWGVAHLTFEDESIPCILLANFGQLSAWRPPGFGLLLMHTHYLSGECCYQNSGFP
jgi:hypothetical protein